MITTKFIIFIMLYLATAVTHGIFSRLFNKHSSISASKRAFISFLFGTLPVVAAISIFTEFSIQDTRLAVFYLLSAGLAAALFHVLTMTALKHIPASRWQVLNGSYVAFSALIAFFFLGESISLQGLIGIVLVLAGIIVVAYNKMETGTAERRYDLIVLLASLAVAIALVFQSKATKYASNGVILLAMAVIQTIFLAAANFSGEKGKISKFNRRDALSFGFLGVLNGVLSLFYLMAQNNSSSIAVLTTSTSLSIPISATAAIILLKEKSKILQKVVGAIFVFLGVILFGLS